MYVQLKYNRIKVYLRHTGKICKQSFQSPQAVHKHKKAEHAEQTSKSKLEIQNVHSTISGDLVRRLAEICK